MLVLTRKTQQSVVVGGSDSFQRALKVTVLEIRGEKVKLGFDVDPDVPVHRQEVWERIFGNGQSRGSNHVAGAPVAEYRATEGKREDEGLGHESGT